MQLVWIYENTERNKNIEITADSAMVGKKDSYTKEESLGVNVP